MVLTHFFFDEKNSEVEGKDVCMVGRRREFQGASVIVMVNLRSRAR